MRATIWCAVVVFGLAACARPESPAPRDTTAAPPTSSTAATTAPTTASTSGAPATTSPGPGPTSRAQTTLRGVVEPGVEGGCLLLQGYLLLGGDPQVVRAGADVVVEGRPAPGQMTTCQQGIPFEVSTATPAPPTS